MELKLQKVRHIFHAKEEDVCSCLILFDGNGNEQFRVHHDKIKTKFTVSDTELSVLNALLEESRTRTFQLRIFADSFICFLTAGGVLIGRGRFNDETGNHLITDDKSDIKIENENAGDGKHGLFIAEKMSGYTALLRGFGKSERSLLELFNCVRQVLSKTS